MTEPVDEMGAAGHRAPSSEHGSTSIADPSDPVPVLEAEPRPAEALQFQQLRLQLERQTERAMAAEQGRVEAARRHAQTARRLKRVTAELAELEQCVASSEQARSKAEAYLAELRAQHAHLQGHQKGAQPSTFWRTTRKGAKRVWRSLTRQTPSKRGKSRGASPGVAATRAAPGSTSAATAAIPTVRDSLRRRFEALLPLRTYPGSRSGRRLSIVTDSINPGLLYGGVGTAILFATLLANRIGADLRLITRHHEADPGQIGSVLTAFGVRLERTIECVFSPPHAGSDVPVFAGDLFLTTSWWTTKAAQGAVDTRQIIYLLQEDERMFYPSGDERLRCAEVLGDEKLRFVVNSEILFRHFGQGEEPLPNIVRNGCWFEPAFPYAHYHDDVEARKKRSKKSFLFYARPNNLRNMYWRGLEAIAGAIEDGILAPEVWNVIFVGRDLEPIALPRGVNPKLLENLPWTEYAALIRQVDVGLSLIDTPHPSYPPLDLAASGAVVVTNRCGIKTSLARYSGNILCAEPSVDGLKEGLRRAIAIADDEALRSANYARSGIMRDWPAALEPAVRLCAEVAG